VSWYPFQLKPFDLWLLFDLLLNGAWTACLFDFAMLSFGTGTCGLGALLDLIGPVTVLLNRRFFGSVSLASVELATEPTMESLREIYESAIDPVREVRERSFERLLCRLDSSLEIT
jgi:hypothetical protein